MHRIPAVVQASQCALREQSLFCFPLRSTAPFRIKVLSVWCARTVEWLARIAEKKSVLIQFVSFHQATNEVVARVPKATTSEMEAAVASCKKAFWNWSETSVLSRQQIFLRYQQLIKDNLVRHCGSV